MMSAITVEPSGSLSSAGTNRRLTRREVAGCLVTRINCFSNHPITRHLSKYLPPMIGNQSHVWKDLPIFGIHDHSKGSRVGTGPWRPLLTLSSALKDPCESSRLCCYTTCSAADTGSKLPMDHSGRSQECSVRTTSPAPTFLHHICWEGLVCHGEEAVKDDSSPLVADLSCETSLLVRS